jgi:hypothetical protein
MSAWRPAACDPEPPASLRAFLHYLVRCRERRARIYEAHGPTPPIRSMEYRTM